MDEKNRPGKSGAAGRKGRPEERKAPGEPVADESKSSPFDVERITELVGLMSRHDLSEIDLRKGSVRIRLRRGTLEAAPPAASAAAAHASAPATHTPVPREGAAKPAEPPKPSKPEAAIKSPTPGTFYASPTPEADPFVRVGSRVTPTTVVCIIEAMKIFNEITADCTGVITEVLAENQQPVEYGQVLFKVDPAG